MALMNRVNMQSHKMALVRTPFSASTSTRRPLLPQHTECAVISDRRLMITSAVGSNPPQGQTPGAPGAARPPKKKSKKLVDINGDVSKDLGNGMFQIKLENGVTVMAHLSGKIRQNRIKIVMGDKVTVELSPYDLTKGRITYRFRPGEYDKLQQAAAAGSK
ncbi:hypothetical protein CEUSTIGMA_g10134.t1 [Chlamydomonas eustigma]|uniref:Translation initiation factor IF-1, chloroplastic n=1 Tax=Chlamydomonas eustigma TaxID=1157962 RepID=A0A250XI06_9CHLO|nr:hypothetical protein CEUSTIGMA_g10134.t1 [Chlamydomonas eustigma]|eukprot:GAX82708.1 hypothetical protein CEUSTIGMA_g10134.t1 [Chlamydomonas eustigma]